MLEITDRVPSQDTGYSLQEVAGNGKRTIWDLSINGETYRLNNAAAATARVLLEHDGLLTSGQIEEMSGYTNPSSSLKVLEEYGLLRPYKTNGTRALHYVMYPEDHRKTVPNTFYPYERKPHNTPRAMYAEAPAAPQIPEHNPSPLLTSIPYIPVKETSAAFKLAVDNFAREGKPGFQQAHGGRYVWMGEDYAPSEKTKKPEGFVAISPSGHPVPDMIL